MTIRPKVPSSEDSAQERRGTHHTIRRYAAVGWGEEPDPTVAVGWEGAPSLVRGSVASVRLS